MVGRYIGGGGLLPGQPPCSWRRQTGQRTTVAGSPKKNQRFYPSSPTSVPLPTTPNLGIGGGPTQTRWPRAPSATSPTSSYTAPSIGRPRTGCLPQPRVSPACNPNPKLAAGAGDGQVRTDANEATRQGRRQDSSLEGTKRDNFELGGPIKLNSSKIYV
jgi:hypothetical protein